MYVCSNQNGKQFLWAWHFINKLATRQRQGEHEEVICRRGNNWGGWGLYVQKLVRKEE